MALTPPPPLEMLTFWPNFKKKMLPSQNFFRCSQNLPKHILVLKNSILKPLFTVYRLLKNTNFGVDPLPPLLEKNYILDFFFAPFPNQVTKFQRLQFTKLPSYKVTKFKDTKLHSYKVTKLTSSNPPVPGRLAEGRP